MLHVHIKINSKYIKPIIKIPAVIIVWGPNRPKDPVLELKHNGYPFMTTHLLILERLLKNKAKYMKIRIASRKRCMQNPLSYQPAKPSFWYI